MLELLCRLTAINKYAKDCHYRFEGFGQHLLADVNQEEMLDYTDLVNEVCFLGVGLEAPKSEDVLAGALKFIPEVNQDDKINLTNLKELIHDTLAYIQTMNLSIVGVGNLIGGIAQDLLQIHGLLYREGIRDKFENDYTKSYEDSINPPQLV